MFSAGFSDHFRNRLTHTLEVTQICRTIAVALGLNESLTEALALAHDIGHPPFAHAGEQELNRQMARFEDSFEHNRHALRIVDRFEQHYARFPGLNLTFEVREGILKHSRDLEPGVEPDLEEFLPGLRPPLEAQLIDLGDEIAYNTADLDDALDAGLIHAGVLAHAVPEYAEVREAVATQFPGAGERIQFHESLRRLMDILVTSLVAGTRDNVLSAGVGTVDEVRQYPVRLAGFTPEGASLSRTLKAFLQAEVYNAPTLIEERRKATTRIAELFHFYLRHLDRLPPAYADLAAGEAPHRVVCDYIAGMTDGFFQRMYTQAFGDKS